MFAYVKFVTPNKGFGVVETARIQKFQIPFDKFNRYKVYDEGIKKRCLIHCVKGK